MKIFGSRDPHTIDVSPSAAPIPEPQPPPEPDPPPEPQQPEPAPVADVATANEAAPTPAPAPSQPAEPGPSTDAPIRPAAPPQVQQNADTNRDGVVSITERAEARAADAGGQGYAGDSDLDDDIDPERKGDGGGILAHADPDASDEQSGILDAHSGGDAPDANGIIDAHVGNGADGVADGIMDRHAATGDDDDVPIPQPGAGIGDDGVPVPSMARREPAAGSMGDVGRADGRIYQPPVRGRVVPPARVRSNRFQSLRNVLSRRRGR